MSFKPASRRLNRVEIFNFKSIAHCCLDLPTLTIMVGPNASGKSNFLEAIEFICECLEDSVEAALRLRGGIDEVQRKAGDWPRSFTVSLSASLNDAVAEFELVISTDKKRHFRVSSERCQVTRGNETFSYLVRNGVLHQPPHLNENPKPSRDRLYLMKNLGNELAEEFVDYLTSFRFYNIDPNELRDLQPPDVGDFLAWNGWNIASVWRRIIKENRSISDRVLDYLVKIAPDVKLILPFTLGPKETLRFYQHSADDEKFISQNMSEGTLRAFALLVALLQPPREDVFMDFIAVEEPEKAVHPAVLNVIFDAIREASATRQVIVTSHSPELLDRDDLEIESIVAVAQRSGTTEIGAVSGPGREALREHLYTAGELLRMDQIAPSEVVY